MLGLFADDLSPQKNPKGSTPKRVLELVSGFGKIEEYKISTYKKINLIFIHLTMNMQKLKFKTQC